MLLHNISIMTPHRQMRRLFLKNKKLIISVALQIRENALWLYRRVLESVCGANREFAENRIAFFFPLRGVCVVFRRRKAEQTFFSDFGRRKARFHKPDSVAFALFYCLVA